MIRVYIRLNVQSSLETSCLYEVAGIVQRLTQQAIDDLNLHTSCPNLPYVQITNTTGVLRIENTNTEVYWVICMHFCHLLIFFKINFFEKFFQEYHQSVRQYGSRSDRTKYRA